MLRQRVEEAYRKSLYNLLVEREADLIEQELKQEDAKQIFLNRAINGIQGYRKMTVDEMIAESGFCEEWVGETYIFTLAEHLMKDEYKEDLELLLSILGKNGHIVPAMGETCPRRKALISYLEDINLYKDVIRIEAGDKPNYFNVVFNESETPDAYKVYSEQECIDELAKWYESDMDCMWFYLSEIADVLQVPEEMLEVLGLLNNVDDGCGEGTKFLYETLKKAGKLKELASHAKENNFAYLASDDNSAKMEDYYILDASYK